MSDVTNTAQPLAGRTAFLSGATGHLGKEMALALGGAGAEVLVNSRNAERGAELASELQGRGIRARAAIFDVAAADAGQHLATIMDGAALHILVNNAYSGNGGTVGTASDDDYRDAYDMVVVAAQRLVSAMLPNLALAATEPGGSSIVNISSMYGLVSPDPGLYATPEGTNPPFYGAAKAALAQLTRYMACELGPRNIRSNAIAPGPFPNPQTCTDNREFVEELTRRVPMKRIGQPEEIGGPLVFLAGPQSSYVNGAVLTVDGGWTAW